MSPDAAKTPTVGGKVLLQTRISFILSLAIGVTTRAVLPYICGTDAECERWWGGGVEGICLGTAVAAGKIRDIEYGSDSAGRHCM